MSPQRSEVASQPSAGAQSAPIASFGNRREFVPSRVLLGAPVQPLGVAEVQE